MGTGSRVVVVPRDGGEGGDGRWECSTSPEVEFWKRGYVLQMEAMTIEM